MSSQPVISEIAQQLPRTFGRYQLFDRIGVGGMAEIYLARAHTELGGSRLVVVKLILPNLSDNEQFAEMLIAEAKVAARLSHANVVQVFDLGRYEGVLFIAMDYVEGFDLNEILRRCARFNVPLPIDFSLFIVMEALRGLGYAHRVADESGNPIGIVHRDVSPSNVLISFDGDVKLCDFGIARANDMADLLSEDVIKGKAGYMSPEQAWAEDLDARADVFATGIVLWELLAGRKLYRPKNEGSSLIDLAREAEIPSLPDHDLPYEQDLHQVVFRALARDRDRRYASANAMLLDLEDYVGRAGLIASPIRFGSWLREHFEDIVTSRRSRERGAEAIAKGPLVVLEPIRPSSAPPSEDEVSGERARSLDRESTDELGERPTAPRGAEPPGDGAGVSAAPLPLIPKADKVGAKEQASPPTGQDVFPLVRGARREKPSPSEEKGESDGSESTAHEPEPTEPSQLQAPDSSQPSKPRPPESPAPVAHQPAHGVLLYLAIGVILGAIVLVLVMWLR